MLNLPIKWPITFNFEIFCINQSTLFKSDEYSYIELLFFYIGWICESEAGLLLQEGQEPHQGVGYSCTGTYVLHL